MFVSSDQVWTDRPRTATESRTNSFEKQHKPTTNNVISSAYSDEIDEVTTDAGGGKWPILTQVEGPKQVVEQLAR